MTWMVTLSDGKTTFSMFIKARVVGKVSDFKLIINNSQVILNSLDMKIIEVLRVENGIYD